MTKRYSRRVERKPTWTSKALAALVKADDFMSVEALKEATLANWNQLSAALHHLKKYNAIDSIESAGKLYFFATPAFDKRSRHVEERVPEEPGSRGHRKQRTVKVSQ